MRLGTGIAPQQIGLMFGVIVAPTRFSGCAYHPRRGLDAVPVMKYLVVVNPLVISLVFWPLDCRRFSKRAIG